MSRLTDLLRQARLSDPQLGAALEEEVGALMRRRSFGLVFEHHQPEAVELPHQRPRRGSKVRILPPRGTTTKGDAQLWRVISTANGNASLEQIGTEKPERVEVAIDDLVVVAEFQDVIYPGLVETGRIERGGDKPAHTVINSENFHALEMLTYTHRHKIDAIYIDPPYNTGARDWKYNNDYVEKDDDYRHSKWLSFMERRLLLARELLNLDNSVLIVTIDEKEYLRLGLLLEQLFPDAEIQMVSSVINPKGTARRNEFSRVDEFIFFVMIGDYSLVRTGRDMLTDRDYSAESEVRWRGLARTGRKGLRPVNPGSWYPIYLNTSDLSLHSIGDTVPVGASPKPAPEGTVEMWPPQKGDDQYSWSVVPETLRALVNIGAVRLGRPNKDRKGRPVYYLTENQLRDIESGVIAVNGRADDGSMNVSYADAAKTTAPKTQWNMTSHEAGSHGTNLLAALLPGRSFPFPKSLYAVEDALRFFVANNPNAIILDFFAGSGTTAHAVMRLNRQDNGARQCISITNNEVSFYEQARLRRAGLRPGDLDWEALGICDYVTKPRIEAAITGLTADGDPITGDYKFTDEFPMSDGFEENARFFTLTYESPLAVRHHRAFGKIAPMLWLRAGARGRLIESLGNRGWDLAEAYAVLENISQADAFLEALSDQSEVRTVFVVTDDDSAYQMVARELPETTDVVRLYESYLQNFEINQGGVL